MRHQSVRRRKKPVQLVTGAGAGGGALTGILTAISAAYATLLNASIAVVASNCVRSFFMRPPENMQNLYHAACRKRTRSQQERKWSGRKTK